MAACAGGFTVNMPAAVSRSKNVGAPTSVTAGINFNRDGTITNDVGGSIGDWVSPRHATIGDLYDVKYDYGSGDALSSGAAASGTWIQMSANRTFENTAA